MKKQKNKVNKGQLSLKRSFKKYKFRKYNPVYPKLFLNEKKSLLKIFPKHVKLEHVGSTSIPGLGGKGIIDIAIRTPKNKIIEFTKKLGKLGYKQTISHQDTRSSRFFQRIIRGNGKERRIHVHLVLNQSYFNTFTAVRDYLKTHPEETEKYAELKRRAVKFAKGDGKKYRAYKNKFLEKLTKKSLKEYSLT